MTSRILTFASLAPLAPAALALGIGLAGCQSTPKIHCYADGTCVTPDGCVDSSGNEVCCPGECDTVTPPPDDGNVTPPDTDPEERCKCTPKDTDPDGDCLTNDIEAKDGTDPAKWDTDGDGVGDGCEDYNHNGALDAGEMNPLSTDTDGDGIPDGIEDANHSGRRDIPGETSAVRADTDGDGIPDGVEDADHDGVVDPWTDMNGNGLYDQGIDLPGETDPRKVDSDGDGIPDGVEDADHDGDCQVVWTPVYRPPPCDAEPILVGTGETCSFLADTDADGIPDGREDKNGDGLIARYDPNRMDNETDPLSPDTDLDCLPDGVEDANGDGLYDPTTETSPLLPDSDFDGIVDGAEDRNWNGRVDPFVSSDPHGCFTNDADTQGETDPRKADSDGDGIPDGVEDTNHDGLCNTAMLPSRSDPSRLVRTFTETCAWLADTDCDGLTDGREDVNHNGKVDPGETNPRDPDTDLDGLPDGCQPWTAPKCEDANDDGVVAAVQDLDHDGSHDFGEPGETDPLNYDSDHDGLSDGCELNFAGGPTDPLNPDTDGDGELDGAEDANHDCAVDDGETDPRVFNAPPAANTFDNAKFQVCAAQNLKQLTWARTTRSELDYQLAFEVERNADTGAESQYIVVPFGKDNDGDGNVTGLADALYGHVFQTGPGVTPSTTGAIIQRQIYGFVIATEDTRTLDTALDAVRDALAAEFPDFAGNKGIEEFGALTERPAHDDLPAFPVLHAQRQFHVRVSTAKTSLAVRNSVLLDTYLRGQTPDPAGVLPVADAMFGATAPTYASFTLYIGAAERPKQKGPTGLPVIVSVVALTPDDSTSPDPAPRYYAERVTRLEDLTGGSALARSENPISNTCEDKRFKRADADLLWVVDDSSSMQSLIKHLQNAASDAHAVLTANASVVDFRVAMTTTNPSRGARTQCYKYSSTASCGATCLDDAASGTNCLASCGDQYLGCMYVCPAGCATSCDPATGVCTCGATCSASCGPDGTCIDPTALALGIATDAAASPLPGGGGTFYYEDGGLLDCNSASSTNQDKFINYCGGAEYSSEFAPFLNTLAADAGFLGSNYTDACTTKAVPMDLSAKTSMTQTSCVTGDEPYCCPRLTEPCSDGPTVLESGMCDLIRAMGGLPASTSSQFSGRAHASTENGVRSARRLLESMLPALPRDYTGPLDPRQHLRRDCCESCDPATDATCAAECCTYCDPNSPASDSGSCTNPDQKLTCNISPTCTACDPRIDADCVTSPLVTLFLSDEEDYFFKDECHVSLDAWGAPTISSDDIDQSALPELCRYGDDDASTAEPCDEAACSGLATDPPAGYNPDQTGWASDVNARFGSLRLRPSCFKRTTQSDCNATDGCAWISSKCQGATAADPVCGGLDAATCAATTGCASINGVCYGVDRACSPRYEDRDTSCVGDPCPQLRDQTSCEAYGSFYSDPKFQGVADLGGMNLCAWDSSKNVCRNACADKVKTYQTVSSATSFDQVKGLCTQDARCRFDPSLMTESGDMTRTCQLALELNDCRACKRWRRSEQALKGSSGNAANCAAHTSQAACDATLECSWIGGTCASRSLPGFVFDGRFAGPVYAITREAGKPGSGAFTTGTRPVAFDECQGSSSTWGRGDGSAYRDLAIATQGRTQNVCAASYKDFMQLLVTDIVALSAPYPLAGWPISSTIKVGLARPNDDGTWSYLDVPRSSSRGFVYNVTTNSLGFKNDPIPGDCTYEPGWTVGQTCDAAGEIESARNVPFIPKEKDLVFISYRYWLPVPCRDQCTELGQTCSRVLCSPADTSLACTQATDCPDVNDTCVDGHCSCADGSVVDRCRAEACPLCQVYDPTTSKCIDDTAPAGTCACFDPGDPANGCAPAGPNSCDPCMPGGPNTCPMGEICAPDKCVCVQGAVCDGAEFDSQGDFAIEDTSEACRLDVSQCSDCQAALSCCNAWAGEADACGAYTTESACNADATCAWAVQGGRCLSKTSSPCCNPGETPTCYELSESNGMASIWCRPEQCTCQGPTCATPGCEGLSESACTGGCAWDAASGKCHAPECEPWQTCEGGSCTPACQPLVQFCDTASGCVCANNPG